MYSILQPKQIHLKHTASVWDLVCRQLHAMILQLSIHITVKGYYLTLVLTH
jgi:hypothetical protein